MHRLLHPHFLTWTTIQVHLQMVEGGGIKSSLKSHCIKIQ